MTATSQTLLLRTACSIGLLLLHGLVGDRGLEAQGTATVTVEENVRADPQGTVLGRLLVGTVLPVAEARDPWLQVDLEGWIWTRSVQATQRQGFDLVVSASPEENLRLEPSGRILARLLEGTLLDRLEEVPGWTRVRRRAWVWGASVRREEAPTGQPRPERPVLAGGQAAEEWWRAGAGTPPLLSTPDGDTLAVVSPGTDLRVLAREGNWLRVRMEAWVWAPPTEPADSTAGGSLVIANPADVARTPDAYRGATVEWDLQFISAERAERVRTDFYEGEPFLLARAVGDGNQFVYVAVPPERLGEVEGLIPLERIRVKGRIRVGAAALTGNPILDLLQITRF